ncbi:hypothetical protein OVA03_09440 [Asticcacaulis sp. SL142]|jgi:hypothetical protein|uniref:hypothetical protein n=1 Tax=Asticcacaulis sp. SL142 TaxID=2995155 RepID=UPI00226C797E|nr:hypothetical protein [Asticcacaulis sp. SL142]WAC46937.1 hypothetical protein OVA03_09440 [Asticcacaulis sp. SL142]
MNQTAPEVFSLDDLDNGEQTIHNVIAALDYIKSIAEAEGETEVAELIGATFTICLNTYSLTKRLQLREKIERDMGLQIRPAGRRN